MDPEEVIPIPEQPAEEGEEVAPEDAFLYSAEYLAKRESERIINQILYGKRVNKDWKDISRHPSYSKFQVPLHIQCRDRYIYMKKLYEAQFQREIAEMLNQQSSAYEAARFQRHIAISTLWPPLHNRHEINYVKRNFFRLNSKQQKRYNYIMSTKII